MTKKKHVPDFEFQKLTSQIKKQIDKNLGLIGDQKEQVELLVVLENKFKFNVQKYQKTIEIYRLFINFILNEQRNILTARPYFREKTEVFCSGINKAIKGNDPFALMNYNINYQFVNFIKKHWNGPFPTRVQKYYNELLETRRILIENNMPLVINRAKLFYNLTPPSHLSLIDFIDLCVIGLISGIDKYAGEYRPVWRSVCIGRMTGNMIDEYSKTFLRLYPTDKRILYKANSLRHSLKIENMRELAEAVNKSFEQDRLEGKKIPSIKIDEVYLEYLMNGASYISADSRSNEEDETGVNVYDYTPSTLENPEEKIIHKDLINKISISIQTLEIIEKKIIALKGVEL